MNTCDIIIPAYNNSETLPHVIEALNAQHIPPGWDVQILLCDDGSKEKVEVSASWRSEKLKVKILSSKHAGAAAARNRGIRASQATIIFLLGADIVLRPGALAEHIAFHEGNPGSEAAALGFVMWDPRVRPTPLMEWMTHGGPQNNFDDLLDSSEPLPFFASHVSVKRSKLAADLFSEEYVSYGWEDIELGHRLRSKGMQLHLLTRAVGLHHHFYSADDVFRRQFLVGVNKHLFCRHTKQAAPALAGRHRFQLVLYAVGPGALLRMTARYLASRYVFPRLFAHAVNYEYRRGLWAGTNIFPNKHTSYPQAYPQ